MNTIIESGKRLSQFRFCNQHVLKVLPSKFLLCIYHTGVLNVHTRFCLMVPPNFTFKKYFQKIKFSVIVLCLMYFTLCSL